MAEHLFDEAFLRKLDMLQMRFSTAVNNLYSGGRRSKMHGSTVEFANFREYIQGDDFRRIDWNAYGRFEKFFIKLFLDEKQLCTNIFIDTSESMNFGTPTKLNAALKIGAAFAYISVCATDRVSVTGLANKEATEICSGISGKAPFFGLLEKLEQLSPSGQTGLCEALRGCRSLSGSSGASILISDLMSGDDYKDTLKYLIYQKQQTVLVHLISPEEINPQLDGRIRLLDSENQTYCEIEANQKTLDKYKEALKAYEDEIRNYCLKAGIYYLPVRSDEDIAEVIMEKGTAAGIFF